MNQYQMQIRHAAEGMLGWPYDMGGWGGPKNDPPYGLDCRAFVQRAYRLSGVLDRIGGPQGDVRHMIAAARAEGSFVGPDTRPGLLWPVFYYEETDKPEPGNPEHWRHVALVNHRINAKYPQGQAMSAYSPKAKDAFGHKGTIIHDLIIPGLKIGGFCNPKFASIVEPTPAGNPEPPLPDPAP